MKLIKLLFKDLNLATVLLAIGVICIGLVIGFFLGQSLVLLFFGG